MCNPQFPWRGFWAADIGRARELMLKLQHGKSKENDPSLFSLSAWRLPLFPFHSSPPVDPVLSLLMRKMCAPSHLSAIVNVQSSLSALTYHQTP